MRKDSISHIEIRKAGNDEFYFVFRLPGDGMFVSIFFDRMSEVMAAVEYAQRNSTSHSHYHDNKTQAEETSFALTTNGKKPIGQSTIFENTHAMNAGKQYMQKHFQKAEIVDLTI